MCVCESVRLSLINQHRNTRFTAPACQDSLWPQGFHHLPAHPVETKTAQKSEVEEDKDQGGKRKEEGSADRQKEPAIFWKIMFYVQIASLLAWLQ